MLQHNNANANNGPVQGAHSGGIHARCCAAQASSAMMSQASFASAMSPLGTTPPNTHESALNAHHHHHHHPHHQQFIDSRPKRDFQFRVIQVRQGPKWFIWPSLHNHHRKHNNDATKHNNNTVEQNNINNKSENVPNNNNVVNSVEIAASAKPSKALHLNLGNDYSDGGNSSDQENNCHEILSPVTPETPTRVFPLNYENVENIMANAPRIPSPGSDESGEGERDGMAKVTATNQLAYYPVPFSEPTSRRLPCFQMPILVPKAPLPPSPLTNSPPQQPTFCVGNDESRGVWLDEKEVADLYASYAESQEKYQEKIESIAHRLHQNQQHAPPIQRTKSVVNAPSHIANSYCVDVGYILGDATSSSNANTQPSNAAQAFHHEHMTSSETSGYVSTASTTAATSGNNSGAFEILAVSKKEENEEEENEDIDFELEADSEEQHFGDSGYFVSAPGTRTSSRSGSVVEYYSISGCYTCIQGECLNANEQKDEQDITKRYSLCLTAFQDNDNNDVHANNNDANNNVDKHNSTYICDNCKINEDNVIPVPSINSN